MSLTNLSLKSTLTAALMAGSLIAAAPCALSQTGTTTPAKAAATTTAKSAAATPAKKPATGTATKSTTAAKKPATAAAAPVLTTPAEKQSYALGANIGMGIKGQSIPVQADLVARGLADALSGGKVAMTQDEIRAALTALQAEARKTQEDARKKLGDANKADGDKFMAENKAKPGVVTLPSGLQYKVITMGTGPKPTAADTVECNYRGTLVNGTQFDSSYDRKESVKFPVAGVIKGWTEALQLMPVGSKWQLVIPPSLAYGSTGNRGIEPESTLVFEVELLGIVPKPEEKKEMKLEDLNHKMDKMDDHKMDEKKPEMPKADAPK